MRRSRVGLGIGRAAASAALVLTAFTSFGAALLVDSTPAHALPSCTETWTGATSDAWSTNTNWSPATVPGPSSVVCIGNDNTDPSYSVSLTSGATVDSIQIGGTTPSTLTVDNTSLTLDSTSGDSSAVLSGGTLDIDASGSNAGFEIDSETTPLTATVDSGGAINTSVATGDIAYLGYNGSLDIASGGSLTASGVGTTTFYSQVAVTDSGTVTADAGTTVQATSTSFTNAGSIVNNGTFDEDTDFNVTTGSESGANPVTITGGNFDDDTAAGSGAYTATNSFNLDNPVPTGQTAGVATGQTLTITNTGGTNYASSFTDNGTIDVTASGSNADLYNESGTTNTITVDSGGAINTSVATGDIAYLGSDGSLDIASGGSLTASGVGTTTFYSQVAVTDSGTVTADAGTTVQATSTSFTNAGSIVNNGTFDEDTDFNVTTGSESGANPVTITGGNFDDDTAAGSGAYTATNSFNLDNPVPTGQTAGVATGQTLTITNTGGTNYASSFTDNGTIDVTASGSNADLYNESGTTNTITVASGGALDTSVATGDIAYLGYDGSLDIASGGSLTASGVGTTTFYSQVAVTDSGTVTADVGTTVQATSTSFTNAGSIVNNGTFDEDTDFNVTTGSESGANPVTITGGNFDDDTAAGSGAYKATNSFNLDNPVPTGQTAGVATGQTLTITNTGGTNYASSFTDNGTIDVTASGSNATFYNESGTTNTITVASGGALDTSVATGDIAYLGSDGSLDIARGGSLTASGVGTTQFYSQVAVTNNGTLTVADGSNLAIGGDFTQGEFGTVAVTSDTTAGTKSQITGGTDILDGTLDVTTIGTPATYSPISSASSRTGYFATLDYNGVQYTTAYTTSPNDVTLTPSSSGYELAGLTLSSTSVGATGVAYTIDLKGQAVTSGTTTFTVTSPAGTTFPTYTSNCNAVTFEDLTTSTSEPCLSAAPSTTGGGTTLTFTAPISAAATDELQIQILDVTNGATADPYSLTVSNGSVSVLLGYTLTPSTSVGNAAIAASSTSDGASDVVYTTTFTATNGLTADGFSTITLTFPGTYTPPTYTSNCNGVLIYDLTQSTSENCSSATPSTSGQSVTYKVPIAISAGDQVKVVWSGVTNPASSAGTQTFTLATSGDPAGVPLNVTLTSSTSVASAILSASSTSDSATAVLYTANFHSVNELVGGYSTITLTLPSGYTPPTYTSNCNVVDILDITTATSETCESAAPTVSGQSITIQVPPGVTINPGDNVSVAWYGLSNPASQTGSQTFQLSTSADPTPVNLTSVSLTSETGVTGLSMTPSSTTGGATNVTYTATFTSKNGLVSDNEPGANSTISVTFPAGTGLSFASNCNGIVIDDLTTSTSENCSSSTPTLSNGGLTVNYLVPIDVNAGDQVQLTINGVTNPGTTGCSGSLSASLVTTSDPVSESADFTIMTAPSAPTLAVPTVGSGQVNLSWTAGCDNGSPISSYTLLRSTSSGTETSYKTGLTGTTYQDTGVTNGDTYYYEVEATNGVNTSLASNEESATPTSGVTTENTTTSLTEPTLTYGAEGSPAVFTGTVAGPSGASSDGVPAGTVTVYYDYGVAGQTELCSQTLSGGSGDSVGYTCSITSQTDLNPATYTNVVAVYSGGSCRTAPSPTTDRRRAPRASRSPRTPRRRHL